MLRALEVALALSGCLQPHLRHSWRASEEVPPQVLEHGDTVKKLNATEVAKEAAEGAVRASANAARKAEAALVCASGPCPLETPFGMQGQLLTWQCSFTWHGMADGSRSHV